jgi:hypothetical protein
LSRPARAEGDDCRAVCLGTIGDSHRLCVDIQADIKRARLGQG